MKWNIIYVDLDVDDKRYHGLALDKNTCEVIDSKCRPSLKGPLGQLDKLKGLTALSLIKRVSIIELPPWEKDLDLSGVNKSHCLTASCCGPPRNKP